MDDTGPIETAESVEAGERQGSSDSRDDSTRHPSRPLEIGGRNGPDPVRYGDWEKNGRCIDF